MRTLRKPALYERPLSALQHHAGATFAFFRIKQGRDYVCPGGFALERQDCRGRVACGGCICRQNLQVTLERRCEEICPEFCKLAGASMAKACMG